MKAARIHKFGPPEVIVVEEVPPPVPAAGELLVRVAREEVPAAVETGHHAERGHIGAADARLIGPVAIPAVTLAAATVGASVQARLGPRFGALGWRAGWR